MTDPSPAPLRGIRGLNLALKFVLELCAVVSLAVCGAHTGPAWLRVTLGIGAPLLMILVWGRWCAPRAPSRLRPRLRVPLEMAVFAASAAALAAAGHPTLALVMAAVTAINAVLLTVWHQWAG